MEDELLSSLSTLIGLGKRKVTLSFEMLKQNVSDRIDITRDAVLHQLDEQLRLFERRFSLFKKKIQKHEKKTPTIEPVTKQVDESKHANDLQKLLELLASDKAEIQRLCKSNEEGAHAHALSSVNQLKKVSA